MNDFWLRPGDMVAVEDNKFHLGICTVIHVDDGGTSYIEVTMFSPEQHRIIKHCLYRIESDSSLWKKVEL